VHRLHGALEDVGDDEVALALAQGGQRRAGVADAQPEAGRAEAAPHQLGERLVGLDDELARARPGRGDVAGERAAAAAEVHGRERPVRQHVDDVAHEPDVVELEVRRVGAVDVGLRHAVDRQQPAVVGVEVAQELGLAERDRPPPGGGPGHGSSAAAPARPRRTPAAAAGLSPSSTGTQRRAMLSRSGTTGRRTGTVPRSSCSSSCRGRRRARDRDDLRDVDAGLLDRLPLRRRQRRLGRARAPPGTPHVSPPWLQARGAA
jgi:hypothetical protein